MSNVSYDLDTSGGLMPLIKALIKPPDEEVSTQKPKKSQHPYYKRPGKGHNHDSCDACGEGGDLICCDRCPASFHLGCYDPPLDENDIPAGLWLCKECAGSDAEKPASTRGSRAQSPADNKSDTEKKTRSLRNRSNSSKKAEEEPEKKTEPEPEKELTPMEVLVRAARLMNPRQFELPRDMRIPCPFPGTEKESNGNGKNGSASLVTVDAWGCAPLPARACHACGATCRAAPLLACDYCPLLFHQDCLEPPLTALPTGRWMCPNHVEQYIDWKLVSSASATQRAALWARFGAPVDRHAVAVDFLRRARDRRPCFRVKVPCEARARVRVPAAVRRHYARPPPLLPSRREYVRCNNVLKHLQATSDYDVSESDDDAPKHQICLNLSCARRHGHDDDDDADDHDDDDDARAPRLRAASRRDADDDLQAIADPKVEARSSSGSGSGSSSESEGSYGAPPKRRRAPSAERSLRAAVDEQLGRLDRRLVRLLAWQRLQQILAGEQLHGPWARLPLAAEAAAAARAGVPRARLARLGPRRAPSELLGRAERERIARAVWGAAPPAPAAPLPAPPAPAALRAAAVPLLPDGSGAGAGAPVGMRLSRLTFGADSGCDVVLDAARCRRVSPRHATIFYDEVTRHFELINYSEWGTAVDGVLYGVDLEERRAPRADDAAAALRLRTPPERPARARGAADSCGCRGRGAARAWEGSALLAHGALLTFGCLRYVFSEAAPLAFPYQREPAEPAL